MFNASDGDSHPTSHYINSPGLVFAILLLVITFLVGVPGNILVLWVTGVKMKWTVNTIWFWNLAVADITCCLCLPLDIAQKFSWDWLYGAALCKILPSIVILNMFASIFTLVVISIDRCILVVRPVWAQNHRSLKLAWQVCLVIWILSFLMCLPVFIYRKGFLYGNKTACGYEYENNEHLYNDDVNSFNYTFNYFDLDLPMHLIPEEDFDVGTPSPVPEVIITITRTIFGFLFPLFIISACYIRLTLKVQNARFGKEGRKTTKVVFGIIVAFFMTWAPYHIIGITVLYIKNTTMHTLDEISLALAYSNSCINPILYVFMGKDFKSKLRQSLLRIMESAFSEEMTKTTERSRSKMTTQDSETLRSRCLMQVMQRGTQHLPTIISQNVCSPYCFLSSPFLSVFPATCSCFGLPE
ncbi:C3a anaphylatoxin chemotactic receptor [Mixophyes fleayi]|uniref:C3a anaphylatoxin chemotactic receptor n=1 Tax=Mixophyes fleayi TaxID=3061075 RepID=UPI003F4E3008